MTTSTPRETIAAAVSLLEQARTFPIPKRVELAVLRWGRRSPRDARAALMLIRLTTPETIDAHLALLRDGLNAAGDPRDTELGAAAHRLALALTDGDTGGAHG